MGDMRGEKNIDPIPGEKISGNGIPLLLTCSLSAAARRPTKQAMQIEMTPRPLSVRCGIVRIGL